MTRCDPFHIAACRQCTDTPLSRNTDAPETLECACRVAFSVTAEGGTQPVTIDVSNASGEATLVYQVDFSNGSPIDITSVSGLTTLTDGLAVGTPVALAGIAQSDGTLRAYVLTYFTHTTPSN